VKLSNYSVHYAPGPVDDSNFLAPCRALGLEKARLHTRNLVSTEAAYLKRVRDEFPDQGISVSMFSVSTHFGKFEGKHEKAPEIVFLP